MPKTYIDTNHYAFPLIRPSRNSRERFPWAFKYAPNQPQYDDMESHNRVLRTLCPRGSYFAAESPIDPTNRDPGLAAVRRLGINTSQSYLMIFQMGRNGNGILFVMSCKKIVRDQYSGEPITVPARVITPYDLERLAANDLEKMPSKDDREKVMRSIEEFYSREYVKRREEEIGDEIARYEEDIVRIFKRPVSATVGADISQSAIDARLKQLGLLPTGSPASPEPPAAPTSPPSGKTEEKADNSSDKPAGSAGGKKG